MAKYKYVTEFEINASTKMLFPYLSTAGGLQEWFADDVSVLGEKSYNVVWDGVGHTATIMAKRTNHYIKYEFLPVDKDDEKMNETRSYIEFKLEHNDITASTFLQVVDFSEMENEEDLASLWEQLVEVLREKVGG